MNGESLDIKQTRLQELKGLFPDLFVENQLDWEKLKAAFGDDINFANERYVLNWAGKSDAFKVLQQPTTATLKPIPEESVNFDKSENLFIEGENLEVLKVLQKAYYGKMKCIIIDPPYNTGSDSFIYPDKFSEKKEDYLKRIGDKDEEGYLMKEGLFRKNSKDSGHYHSNWLSMMYPRLFLAKNLLRDDGVIFVHIDDNEVHNLRMVMNEIFGEENFIAELIVLCNPKGRAQDKFFATNHEYILVFSKKVLPKGSFTIEKEQAQIEIEYTEGDDDGKFRTLELRNTHREFGKHNRRNLYYSFYVNPATGDVQLSPSEENSVEVFPNWEDGFEGCWTWGKPKSQDDIDFLIGRFVSGKWKIYVKDYASGATKMLKTILNDKSYFTEKGQKEFNFLFNSKNKIFQAPKSYELIAQLCRTSLQENDIVLDFFGGSGTTAQALLELNKDGGNRKFILVQLPEKCDEDSEAYKAGYKTIADIGKERIRRVIKKIEKEKTEKPDLFDKGNLDLGFKAFKLSSSSFKIWRGAEIDSEEKLVQQLDAFTNPARPGADKQNMLYELMLKAGYGLTSKVECLNISSPPILGGVAKGGGGKETQPSITPLAPPYQGGELIGYYSINDNELIIALDAMSEKLVEQIIAAKPQKVITLDSLFAGNDQLKTNTVLQMRDAGVDFKTI